MKKLVCFKLFENQEDNDLYYKTIPTNDFSNELCNGLIQLSKEENNTIKNLGFKKHMDFFYHLLSFGENLFLYNNNRLMIIEVFKKSDEWYYISDRNTNIKYKCDQFEGLLKCINDIKAKCVKN